MEQTKLSLARKSVVTLVMVAQLTVYSMAFAADGKVGPTKPVAAGPVCLKTDVSAPTAGEAGKEIQQVQSVLAAQADEEAEAQAKKDSKFIAEQGLKPKAVEERSTLTKVATIGAVGIGMYLFEKKLTASFCSKGPDLLLAGSKEELDLSLKGVDAMADLNKEYVTSLKNARDGSGKISGVSQATQLRIEMNMAKISELSKEDGNEISSKVGAIYAKFKQTGDRDQMLNEFADLAQDHEWSKVFVGEEEDIQRIHNEVRRIVDEENSALAREAKAGDPAAIRKREALIADRETEEMTKARVACEEAGILVKR